MENDQNKEYAPYCPKYVLTTGSLAAGILLSFLMAEPENPICSTDIALGEQAGLSLGQTRRARRILERLGFVETEVVGLGGRKAVRYHLNRTRILEDLGLIHSEGLDRRPKRDGDF